MKIRKLLAFIHIEKAAGTTFKSILENNFIIRHCNVKPLTKEDAGVFSSKSMKILYHINPFVRSIAGHSVKPFSDLVNIVPDIKYITILREPFARYISHYQYQVERMRSTFSFEDFLTAEFTHNFQTRKIAGSADIEKAKDTLKKIFFVGIIEEFDQSIIILQKKLFPEKFRTLYQPKNLARKRDISKSIFIQMDKYRSKIESRNLLDLELYDYVKNDLFAEEKKKYPNLHPVKFVTPDDRKLKMLKLRLNSFKIIQKVYYFQFFKYFRSKSRLDIYGSY